MTPHEIDDDERQKHHSQQRELVRSSQQLGELHWRSSAAWWRANTASGARPVLLAKRWGGEEIFPSGRTRSISSMRGGGKKNTPRENRSPSLTTQTRTPKESNPI